MSAAQKQIQPGMILHTRAEIDKMLQDESSEFLHWYCDQTSDNLVPWDAPREYQIYFRSDDGNAPQAWTEVSTECHYDDPAIVYRDDAGGCWGAVAGRWQQDWEWEDTYQLILDEIMRRQAAGQY